VAENYSRSVNKKTHESKEEKKNRAVELATLQYLLLHLLLSLHCIPLAYFLFCSTSILD